MRDLIPRRSEMRTMVDRFFSDIFNDVWGHEAVLTAPVNLLAQGHKYSYPRLNMKETEDSWEIDAAVPGLTKDDVLVDYQNGCLTISASSQNERNEEENGYVVRELHKSSFARRIGVDPEICDVTAIEANVTDGILSIKIPKLRVDTPKEKRIIEVK